MADVPDADPGVVTPLQGVRALDVSRFLAGPYAAWILADLGADVIKVEDVDRPDEARFVGPYFQGEQSLYFAALNSGKRSLALRLRDPEGRAALLEVIRSVDIVLDNHKPGVMDKLGLGHDALREVNPTIITCSLSGFGATGDLRKRAGYDYTIQALSGVMSMTGEPNSPPGKAGISYVDHSGGLAAALAVCAALVGRSRTNRGGHIDLGLFDVQMSMLSYLAAWQLNAGFAGERTPSASHPSLVPAQNFETSDGYVSVFVGNDAMWTRLTKALDDPFLSQEQFRSGQARQRERAPLIEHLASLIVTRPTRHWVDLLEEHHVPCAPVNGLREALREPQVAARGLLGHASHPAYGSYDYVHGPLPQVARGEAAAAPLLGEHSRRVLHQAGLGEARINELLERGVVVDIGHHTPRP